MRIKFGQARTASPCSENHESAEHTIMNAERLHFLSKPSHTRHARAMHAKRFWSKSFMSTPARPKAPPPGLMVLPSHARSMGGLAGAMDKLTLGNKNKFKLKRNKSDDKHMSKKLEFITNIMARHSLDWHVLMGIVSVNAIMFHAFTLPFLHA